MSTQRSVRRLPNVEDRSAEEIARADSSASKCLDSFALRGYSRVDTPLLEETDLFLRKSGGELSSRLYDFTEPGGFAVSIRPEFTAPVLRHAIETGRTGGELRRYSYYGPVYRYAPPEHPDGARTRQFYQLGAELIGAPAPRGDGEIIAMALEGLDTLGITGAKVAVGHVGLIWRLLQKFELSERAQLFLVNAAARLRENRDGLNEIEADAARLGFTASAGTPPPGQDVPEEKIKEILARSMDRPGPNAGARTAAEISARLARKQLATDDPDRFKTALSMLAELVTVAGTPSAALEEGKRLAAENRLDASCFSMLEQVIQAAVDEGASEDRIIVRLGLARGIAYYTGMVFDLLASEDATETLGGGGRYDGLTRALGSTNDVPALGFAYNFDEVLSQTDGGAPSTGKKAPLLLVRPADGSAWRAAAAEAARLRGEGTPAALDIPSARAAAESEVVMTVSADGTVKPGGAR